MWLSSSSVGRKFVMALTGAFLVLFVTFHCLMNSVAICWPAAYNMVCEFLGANWYALILSAILAAFFIVHIIYAIVLTVQNRKARGNDRYAISRKPKGVEWSSQNMFVLGLVILAFLIVHLIQFWAKMQLVEMLGKHEVIPAAAGTLFLQEAFSTVWTPIVYIIGFVALWFHFNHGFWSMFQSIGWDNTIWIPRLKKISAWWTSIVVLLFVAQVAVFTVRAHEDYYKKAPELREQYKDMLVPMFEKNFGPDAATAIKAYGYDQTAMMVRQTMTQMETPEAKAYFATDKEFPKKYECIKTANDLFNYLDNGADPASVEAVGIPQNPNM